MTARTPVRPSKFVAQGRITEIFQQGRRGKHLPEVLPGVESESEPRAEPENLGHAEMQVNGQNISQVNQSSNRINDNILNLPVDMIRDQEIEFDRQSRMSQRSRRTGLSIASRIHSDIAVVASQQASNERAFLEMQRQNQELDDLELQTLELKRQQILRKKQETERHLKERQRLEEERIRLEMQVDDPAVEEDFYSVGRESQASRVQQWLNRNGEHNHQSQTDPLVLPQLLQVNYPSQGQSSQGQPTQGHSGQSYSGQGQPNQSHPGQEYSNQARFGQGQSFQRQANSQPRQEQYERRVGFEDVYPAHVSRTLSAPTQRHETNPIRRDNDQRDEVLESAFRALQVRQVKDLPLFSGENILDWPYFYGEYQRSTQEQRVSDGDNLRRLQKALQGKARATVLPLLSDPKHLGQILRILKMNFGRTEWVMTQIMHQLQRLPPVFESDLEAMRNFYNQVFSLYHASITVKGEDYLLAPQLIVSLAEKLPPFSRNEWSRHKANLIKKEEKVTMNTFLLWLEDELDTMFASYNPMQAKRKRFPEKSGNVLIHQAHDPQYTKCIYCKGTDHSQVWHCEKFKRLPLDDRRKTARTLRVCFNCLEPGHGSKFCKKELRCSICGVKHNKLLHKDINQPTQQVQLNVEYENEDDTDDESLNEINEEQSVNKDDAFGAVPDQSYANMDVLFVNLKRNNVLLRVANVKLFGPSGEMTVTALFDEGSQSTMIDDTLANELGLQGTLSPVTYRWTAQITKHHPDSKIVNCQVAELSSTSQRYDLCQVRTIKNLALPSQDFVIKDIVQRYPQIDSERLKSVHGCTPRLLVGSDHAHLIIPRTLYSYHLNGLQLTRCRLGWTINGPIIPKPSHQEMSLNVMVASIQSSDETLEKLVEEQYKVDNFGIVNHGAVMSKDDRRAVEIMERTLKKVNDRYEIGLPYRYENIKFPPSKAAAMKRLEKIEEKMDADEKFAESYCAKIQDYIEKGYATKLNSDEVTEDDKTMYHSHFGVYNVNKPGKFRLVMDLKAKIRGVSFNDLMLKGPDFVPDLVSVLWRARLQRVGFMADIREMFHQVEIRKEDRCSQRFLFRGMRREGPADVYEMNRMMFGAVCSPSQAQFVKNKNAEVLESQYPGITRAITLQHYVDDYVDSSRTVEEAINRVNNVVDAHLQGGFKLVKFVSNEPEVIQALAPELRGETKEDGIERVLGIYWDLKTDEYLVSFKIPALEKYFNEEQKLTKRQLLRAMMSVFDPLGITLPVLIKLKILFQDLWRKKTSWDEKVPDEVQSKWEVWLQEVKEIGEVRVPRCYFPKLPEFTVADLHVFCDASDKAYCAVVYLVVKENGENHVSFVQAKAKVAPIKHMTVPRLELQACVMGSKLVRSVAAELGIPIVKKHFWTDSKIVLNWFATNEKLNAFVGSRVTDVFEDEDVTLDDWHWIPSELNSGDLATKIQKVLFEKWLSGPEFLKQEESCWPRFKVPLLSPEELVCFHKETIDHVFVGIFNEAQEFPLPDVEFPLPDVERFSNFNRLIRATAYELKMLQALTRPKEDQPTEEELFNISAQDLEEAKQVWYRKVQADYYSTEIMDLMSKGFVAKKSVLSTHSPFLHDGILRVKGRIQDPLLTFEENNPVILPGKHRFTYLLMYMYHKQNNHCGSNTVINNLRQHYDIVGVKVQVRRIFALCETCCKLRAKPRPPQEGNLPLERTTPFVRPFQNVGLDYLGPFLVTVGRRHEKRWVALFSCMVSRACHAEIVYSLTADSAIKAILRMSNLRGVPSLITTDNALGFQKADKELKNFFKNLDLGAVNDSLSLKNSKWKFIPAAAPHFGGFYERKVGSVKRGLEVALKEQYPNDETFATAISEVINCINNTPTGEISNDPEDPRALCPNDLLIGRTNNVGYDVPMDVERKSWKSAQAIAQRYWNRWIKECRPLLQHRRKWYDDRHYKQLQEDDVVLIVDETAKRNTWSLGRIVAVHPGNDGKVRAVTVKVVSGYDKDGLPIFSQLKRPVVKLVLVHRPLPGPENVD